MSFFLFWVLDTYKLLSYDCFWMMGWMTTTCISWFCRVSGDHICVTFTIRYILQGGGAGAMLFRIYRYINTLMGRNSGRCFDPRSKAQTMRRACLRVVCVLGWLRVLNIKSRKFRRRRQKTSKQAQRERWKSRAGVEEERPRICLYISQRALGDCFRDSFMRDGGEGWGALASGWRR
jgi:hypothetical protein